MYAGGSTTSTRIGEDNTSAVARRGLLLRGQHPAARAAACAAWTRSRPSASGCRSRPRCSCSTTPRATARPAPRGRHPVDDGADRAGAPARQGRERQRAPAARARALRAAAQRGLRAAARARPRRCTPRCWSRAAPAPRAPRCCVPTARRSPRRGASRRRRPRWPARCCSARRCSCRAAATRTRRGRLGAVGGAAWCASRRRARSAGSTRSSSSTPTRSTSAGACATPAGRRCYVPGAAAIHHEQLSTGPVPERRIVELSRNRDRYMRKHHSPRRRGRRALADGVDLRAARRAPRSSCRATPAALLAPRDRDAASGPRRGPARGGGRLQPRPAAVARPARAGGAALLRPQEPGGEQQQRDRGQRQPAG